MADKPTNKKIDDAYIAYSKAHFDNGIKSDVRTFLAVIIGSAIVGFNMKIFLNQGNLLPAGFSGIASLIQKVLLKYLGLSVPFWPISFSLNIVPAILAYKYVGKKFTIFSCMALMILSFATDLIPSFVVTNDRLLIAVFGGIINGMANALILRNGASVGGSDFIAMYFSVKKGISTFIYVFIINAILIALLGIMFGMEAALYTIIYQFVSTQILNFFYTRYTKKTLIVITEYPKEVAESIMTKTHHACTITKGEGGYTGSDKHLVYAVVGASEVDTVRKSIKMADQKAFINTIASEGVTGNFYQRPIL